MAQHDFINIGTVLLTTAGLWFGIYLIGSLIGRRGLGSSLRAGGKAGFWMALVAGCIIAAGVAWYYASTALTSTATAPSPTPSRLTVIQQLPQVQPIPIVIDPNGRSPGAIDPNGNGNAIEPNGH
jgi:hypothetical protein